MTRATVKLDVAGVLREAWGLARQDQELLLGLAGLLVFVPQLALLLFLTDQPVSPGWSATPAVTQAFVEALQLWFAQNGMLLLVVAILTEAAPIAIILLYVDRRRLDVAGALAATPGVFFPALLARLIGSPIALTLATLPPLLLAGAYLQGRLLIVLPAYLGEPSRSIVGAVRASWVRTRGVGLAMAGLACIAVLAGPLVAAPIEALGRSFGAAPLANPVVALILHGTTALLLTAGAVFGVLVQVVAYRRLSTGT